MKTIIIFVSLLVYLTSAQNFSYSMSFGNSTSFSFASNVSESGSSFSWSLPITSNFSESGSSFSWYFPSNFTFPSSWSFGNWSFSFGNVSEQCMESIMSWTEVMSTCETDFDFSSEGDLGVMLASLCSDSNTSSCTLTGMTEAAANMLSNCGEEIDGEMTESMFSFVAIANSMCLNVGGQYCFLEATNLANAVFSLPMGIIDVENATAQFDMYCTSGCPTTLRGYANQMGALLGNYSMFLNIPYLACTSIDGEYCYIQFYEYLNALEEIDFTTISTIACSDCMRTIESIGNSFEGTDLYGMFTNVPDYAQLCQLDEGSSCLTTLASQMISSGFYSNCLMNYSYLDCATSMSTLVSNLGCCAQTLGAFIRPGDELYTIFSGITMPDLCSISSTDVLDVLLTIQNVNVTLLYQRWNELANELIEEFAQLIGVEISEVNVTLEIPTKRDNTAILHFTILPTTTAYTAQTLLTPVMNLVDSGVVQFSALNDGEAPIGTGIGGVIVSGGSVTIPNPFSFSFSFPSNFGVECMSALTNFYTWLDQCGSTDNELLSVLDSFCGITGSTDNCTYTHIYNYAQKLIDSCPFLGTAGLEEMMKVIAASNAYCASVDGHLCIEDAVDLAYLLADLPSGTITLQNATAAISEYCVTGCPAALKKIGIQMSSVLSKADEFLFMVPSIVCRAIDEDNCFFVISEYLNGLQTENTTTVLSTICSPCMQYVASYSSILEGTDLEYLLEYLPVDVITACQKYDGDFCIKKAAEIANSLNLLNICQSDMMSCMGLLSNFTAQAGCCAKSIGPFVPSEYYDIFIAQVSNAVCTPGTNPSKLKVVLSLKNVNVTRLIEVWDTLKTLIKNQFAELVGVLAKDIVLSYITSSRDTGLSLEFLITPSVTTYDADSLNATVGLYLASGTLQFSALNGGVEGLATSPDGVQVDGGSATIEASNSESSSNPISSGSKSSSQTSPASGVSSFSIFFVVLASLFAFLF